MSSVAVSLNIPAGSGVGTNTDVHTYEPAKTLGCNGTLNPATGETVVVEGSLDPAATEASFFGVCYFQGANEPPKTILASLYWMRVRRIGASAANAPNVEVGSNDATSVQIYFEPVVPSTAGAGPSMDVSTGGELLTVAIQGGIVATGSTATGAGEIYVLEGSNDGSNWSGIVAFSQDNAGAVTIARRYNFVRVSRNLALGGQPTCFLGTSTGGGGSGGGGVAQILAGAGIAVSPGSGVGIVTVSTTGGGDANWDRDKARIYAIDPSAPDDTGLGYADMTGTTAADYSAACALAGTRAKKTNAGLAAIWPSFGADRMVVVLMKAGTYADSFELWFNETSGYQDGFPLVRGTITDPTAGSTAFAGDVNDSMMAGLVTGAAMNAAGYNPTGLATINSIPATKVGGGDPAFAADPGAPVGMRFRFPIDTATVLLRGLTRQIIQSIGTDTSILNADLPVVPDPTDVFFIEQYGVVMPGDINLVSAAPPLFDASAPSVGAQLVGLGNDNATMEMTNVAARLCCVSTGFFTATGGSLETQGLFGFFEPFLVPVGFLRPGRCGGGFRTTGSFDSTWTRLDLNGWIGLGANRFIKNQALSIGFDCVVLDSDIIDCQGLPGEAGPSPESPFSVNLGRHLAGPVPGAPTRAVRLLSGSGTRPVCRLFDSQVDVGWLETSNAVAQPVFQLFGRNRVRLSGPLTGTGNNDVIFDLFQNASESTIEIEVAPTIAGGIGDIRYSGGAVGSFAQLNSEEIYDTAHNHAIKFVPGGGSLSHTINPSAKDAVFVSGAGPATPYCLVQTDLGNAGQVRFASAATAAAAARLVGVLVTGAANNDPCLVADLSGFRVMAFDGAFAVDDEVYLSTTIGLATVSPPTIARRLGMVVQDLGAGLGVVRCAPNFAALGGLSLEETWRETFRAISPAPFWDFWYDPLQIQAQNVNFDDSKWALVNGATRNTTRASTVKCTATGVLAGVSLASIGNKTLTNQRVKKWQFAGAAYWEDAITATADWRAFVLVADPSTYTRFLGMGVFRDVSATNFAFKVEGDASASQPSTVVFSTGWHRCRMWFDGVTLWGAFDDETPIALTAVINNIPAGDLQQRHGAITGEILGGATIYLDAVSIGTEGP